MSEQKQLLDNLFAKLKEISSKFETTAVEKIDQVLDVANQFTVKVNDQLVHLHETMEGFVKKLEDAEQKGLDVADELMVAMSEELTALQQAMQALIEKLKK